MKQTIWTIILILFSNLLTLSLSSFTNLFLLLILPGLLFGFALTLPRINKDFEKALEEIKIGVLYPLIWVVSLGFSFVFQFITSSMSDKTPYIIVGLMSGFGISMTFDWQFGLKNRKIGVIAISALSIAGILLFDYFFPTPHDKELNIGKQIAIWQVLVGLGIIANEKKLAKQKINPTKK